MKDFIHKEFVEVLLNEDYENLTISKLCNILAISRVTFYNHYDNLDHLLDSVIEKELNDLTKMISLHGNLSVIEDFESLTKDEFLRKIYNNTLNSLLYLEKKKTAFRAIRKTSYSTYFESKLKKTFEKKMIESIPPFLLKKQAFLFLKTFIPFFSAGIYSTIEEWIYYDVLECPLTAEQLTNKLMSIYEKHIYLLA